MYIHVYILHTYIKFYIHQAGKAGSSQVLYYLTQNPEPYS